MTVRRWQFALVAGLVLLVATTVAAGGGMPKITREDKSPVGGIAAAASDGIEPDRVVLEVDLRADGSARWSVARRVRLDEPADVDGFERVQRRIRQNRSAFRAPFAQRVRAMATEAQEATGRTMVVENVSVEAERTEIPQEYGVVRYGFRWYGFAATDERLRAGDAMSQLFLDDSTTLLFSWPGNATLATVTPPPDERRDRTVVWDGPVEFARDEPRVVVASDSLSFGPDLSHPDGSNDVLVTLLAVTLVVGTAGVGAGAWRRRRSAPDDSTAAPGEAVTTDATETETADATEDSPATEDAEQTDETTGHPSELLSNEEQVLALLDERDGRMKQQDVVSELDWSETKTSEVVSELRDAGEIDVYRLGRENVLALPETGLGIDTGDDDK